MEQRYATWEVSSWQDAVQISTQLIGWLFRGQSDKEWSLTPSLERIADRHNYLRIGLREAETEILSTFKRQAHHYLDHLPKDENNIEWLSIIQHYGGPTRLLDFSESFYVASFFAVEEAQDTSTVWAINRSILDKQHITEITRDKRCEDIAREWAENSIIRARDPGVSAVRPWRFNKRMITQQGWFLCPLGEDITFELNLCITLGLDGQEIPNGIPLSNMEEVKEWLTPERNPTLIRFDIKPDLRFEILKNLNSMNINSATLFPGLSGFAKSLRLGLRIFEDYSTDENKV